MSWFKRTAKGIQTSTEEKKDIPKGLWYKSPVVTSWNKMSWLPTFM